LPALCWALSCYLQCRVIYTDDTFVQWSTGFAFMYEDQVSLYCLHSW
jgi:hypothetical protein